jgi:hypothetical protein
VGGWGIDKENGGILVDLSGHVVNLHRRDEAVLKAHKGVAKAHSNYFNKLEGHTYTPG